MKYTCEIEINLPRQKVVELFDNPDQARHWQPGLVGRTQLKGQSGQPGSQARLKFKMGRREIEMVETVTARKLPDELDGTYEAKGVWNSVGNRFIASGPDKTRWICEQEFRFSGFMKVIGFLFPGAFKKQTEKYLRQFKDFAEKGVTAAAPA